MTHEELFKEALTEALASCPPVRKRIFKKKLLKGKASVKDIIGFIKSFAPVAAEKLSL